MADSHALLTRSPLRTSSKLEPSFDLHVLGMPPAFVLSQDQTLKFDVRYRSRGKTRQQHRSFSRSRSCTNLITWYVYIGHVRALIQGKPWGENSWERLVFLTEYRHLEAVEPGAAAHMSLHLNLQCQRATQNKRRTVIAPRHDTGGQAVRLFWRPL